MKKWEEMIRNHPNPEQSNLVEVIQLLKELKETLENYSMESWYKREHILTIIAHIITVLFVFVGLSNYVDWLWSWCRPF